VEAPCELHATLIGTQATIAFATCLVASQCLQYLLRGPVLRFMALMDVLPCLASCFTLVLWSACFSLGLLTSGALATNLLTRLA
jgi:hypothetical protein